MAEEPPTSNLVAKVTAQLDALGRLPLAELEPGALLVALTVLGDAVRLGIGVPPPLLRVAEALPENAFRAAFATLLADTRTWSLPAEPGPDEETPSHAWAVRQRDAAESVLVAARRLLVPGLLPDSMAEARALDAAIGALDFTCGGRRGRADVEVALGERVGLATSGSWVSRLPELEREDEGAGVANEGVADAAMVTAPSDEAVDVYVREGSVVRWVEGAARRSPSFAEELEGMIEAGLACRSTVGLVARRWLRSRKAASPGSASGPAASALSLAVLPRLRLAAAAGEVELDTPTEVVELGALYPLDAVATLTIVGEDATLRVDAAPGLELTRVRFGDAVVTAADEEGAWRATAQATAATIALRVEALDGRVFEETLRLEPAT